MIPADGTCRHCKTRLMYLVNAITLKRSDYTGCSHCDVPHTSPCKLCARMNGTVRIKDIPRPPEP